VRRLPAVAVAVALLTFANAVIWSVIIPPFHVPDEIAHTYYAQYVGETGELPVAAPGTIAYADDLRAVLAASGFFSVIGQGATPVPATEADGARLRSAEARQLDRVGQGNASSASNNPPLYHLVQAGVYRVVHGLDVTGRLAVMRLVSALMAGLTALCVTMFLREVLPSSPLSWAVGGLAAGLQPTFAFISSGVNNDAGLFLASAALFWALARCFHLGLTTRRAVACGLALGAGVLVKTQVLAFAPGVALALLVCAWRARPAWRPSAGSLAAGTGAAVAPVLLYGLLGQTLWSRPLVDRVSQVSADTTVVGGRPRQLAEQLSYGWQQFLPRTPNLQDLLPGTPPIDFWMRNLIGRFGWLDYDVPAWMYGFGRDVFFAIAALAVVALLQRRRVLLPRLPEIASYGLMVAGLCAAIAVAGYLAWVTDAAPFEQARYLLPLLPLYALFPAVAIKVLPRRWQPALASLLVAGVLVHGVVAQIATLQRYYG
jgi:4-amino-4-deoxy-L-arabinose transferase-like glycosyltransferase